MRALALLLLGLAAPACAQLVNPPAVDTSNLATKSYVTTATSGLVKSVQSIGPDANGNVVGIATSTMLSNVIIAGDVIQIANPTTGTTVTPAAGATIVLINNSALLLGLTVNMPTSPADGQRFTVASASGITVLTLSGATIKGGLSALSVSGYARFIYSANAGYWFRIG